MIITLREKHLVVRLFDVHLFLSLQKEKFQRELSSVFLIGFGEKKKAN